MGHSEQKDARARKKRYSGSQACVQSACTARQKLGVCAPLVRIVKSPFSSTGALADAHGALAESRGGLADAVP